jgi:hypothetical protein
MAARLYSLFRKDGRNWVREQGAGAYQRSTAVRIFQSRLIDSAFSPAPLSLRPVKSQTPTALEASELLCKRCEAHLHNACLGGTCACICRRFKTVDKGGNDA